jgi:hypothetical protein
MAARAVLDPLTSVPPLEMVTAPALVTKEYAAYLRLSEQRVREQAVAGTCAVPPIRTGGKLLFPTSAVRALLRAESPK